MEVMVVIERVGYDIRTSLEVDDNIPDEVILEMGKKQFKELGVEIKEDDVFDLYSY